MRAIVITSPGGPRYCGSASYPTRYPPRTRSSSGSGRSASTMPRRTCARASGHRPRRSAGSSARAPWRPTCRAGSPRERPLSRSWAGMGRTRNGSYAEYVAAPAANVIPIRTSLSWSDLAAIPESYATAWSALTANLELMPGQSLLVRGATSALGQAAVNIASDVGAIVLATTRRADRAEPLCSLGAGHVVIDGGQIAASVRELVPGGVDRVLDLVGNSVLRDSLRAVRPGGRVARPASSAGSGRYRTSCRSPTCRAESSSASSAASSSAPADSRSRACRCKRSSRRLRPASTAPRRRGCSPSGR